MKHLRERSHYEDLYDRFTVEFCLRIERGILESDRKPERKDIDQKFKTVVVNVALYWRKGERYERREETIVKWMERDRQLDRLYEETPQPAGIVCKFCTEPMELMDKFLQYGSKSEPDHVLFYFRCRSCEVIAKIGNGGRRTDVIPWKCERCSRRWEVTHKKTRNKVTSFHRCSFCGHEKTDVLNLTVKKPKPTDPEAEKRYRVDRDRFCLSIEQGTKFMQEAASFKRFVPILEQIDKEAKLKKAPEIQELTVAQAENALRKGLEKAGFSKLSFGQPEMGREIVILFMVQDKGERGSYDSRKVLKKFVEKALVGTNWTLMSEGITYRLGILSGSLKGREKESEYMTDSNGRKAIF